MFKMLLRIIVICCIYLGAITYGTYLKDVDHCSLLCVQMFITVRYFENVTEYKLYDNFYFIFQSYLDLAGSKMLCIRLMQTFFRISW